MASRSAATLGFAVLALAMSVPGMACYSGLVAVPTAEAVPIGEYGLEPQFDGVLAEGTVRTRLLNTQFGIAPGLDAGLDFDVSDNAAATILGNFKYLATSGSERSPAVALGVCNMGGNVRSSPYVVATHDFEALRGHFGLMRIEREDRWFIGADRAVTDRLTLMADYTNGGDNFASVGINYQFDDNFGILGGVLFPNARGEDTGFTVHLVFTGSYTDFEKGE